MLRLLLIVLICVSYNTKIFSQCEDSTKCTYTYDKFEPTKYVRVCKTDFSDGTISFRSTGNTRSGIGFCYIYFKFNQHRCIESENCTITTYFTDDTKHTEYSNTSTGGYLYKQDINCNSTVVLGTVNAYVDLKLLKKLKSKALKGIRFTTDSGEVFDAFFNTTQAQNFKQLCLCMHHSIHNRRQ